MNHHLPGTSCPLCNEKLEKAHEILQEWFCKVKGAYPETHISWSYRGQVEQDLFVRMGRSKALWPTSRHNKLPAEALDLFTIPLGDKVPRWDPMFFAKLGALTEKWGDPIQWGLINSKGERYDFDHFQLDTKKLAAKIQSEGIDNPGDLGPEKLAA